MKSERIGTQLKREKADPTQRSKSVTLQDIADRCGVCRATVSFALRGHPHLRQETVERIVDMARAMGYDPAVHHAARQLRLGTLGKRVRSHVIAVFLPAIFATETYFMQIFQGMIDVFTPVGYGVLVHVDNYPVFHALPYIFGRGDVDGVIALSQEESLTALTTKLREEANFNSSPIISVTMPHPECLSVLVDDFNGGYLSARHLLQLGHRHLMHFFPEEGSYPLAQRLAGVRKAYTELGLDPAAYLHFMHWFIEKLPQCSADLLTIFAQHPEITGILARNDQTAVQVTEALQRAGKRVPQDYSLVGFDDTHRLPSAYGDNMLTTMQVPLRQVGTEAARMILRVLDDPNAQHENITLPVTLLQRGSTAAPRGK